MLRNNLFEIIKKNKFITIIYFFTIFLFLFFIHNRNFTSDEFINYDISIKYNTQNIHELRSAYTEINNYSQILDFITLNLPTVLETDEHFHLYMKTILETYFLGANFDISGFNISSKNKIDIGSDGSLYQSTIWNISFLSKTDTLNDELNKFFNLLENYIQNINSKDIDIYKLTLNRSKDIFKNKKESLFNEVSIMLDNYINFAKQFRIQSEIDSSKTQINKFDLNILIFIFVSAILFYTLILIFIVSIRNK